MEGFKNPVVLYDEVKNFDMDTDSAEALLEKLPPEQKKRLAKQLLHQEKQRQIERARGTQPSARELFEMRSQAEVARPGEDLSSKRREMIKDWVED